MGAITAEDVNLSPPTGDRRFSYPGKAPVSHVEILDCPYFSMAVFIVSKGGKLPLHDHPGMYGFWWGIFKIVLAYHVSFYHIGLLHYLQLPDGGEVLILIKSTSNSSMPIGRCVLWRGWRFFLNLTNLLYSIFLNYNLYTSFIHSFLVKSYMAPSKLICMEGLIGWSS